MSSVELALETGISVGESPVWVPENGALYFTDIAGTTMNCFSPQSGEHKQWKLAEKLCCFALREQGGVVAAMASGFAFLDLEKSRLIILLIIVNRQCIAAKRLL